MPSPSESNDEELVRQVFLSDALYSALSCQREKDRRAAEEKRIQEGSRLRKQREQLTAELSEVKAQLIKRQSLEEVKTLVASCNVNVPPLVRGVKCS